MFKKKEEDPLKAKLKKQIDMHSSKVQEEFVRKQMESRRLLDNNYVQRQLGIQQVEEAKIKQKQDIMVKKAQDQMKKTDLHAFQCIYCKAWVDMSNLTCPNCGQLFCQWCGAAMDMQNPGLCPRCQRAPMFTPAELVITTVESTAPEDRFWENLPTCPKCGGAVQPDWTDCPICNAKLTPSSGSTPAEEAPAEEFVEEIPPEEVPSEEAPSDDKKKRKEKEKKKSGI